MRYSVRESVERVLDLGYLVGIPLGYRRDCQRWRAAHTYYDVCSLTADFIGGDLRIDSSVLGGFFYEERSDIDMRRILYRTNSLGLLTAWSQPGLISRNARRIQHAAIAVIVPDQPSAELICQIARKRGLEATRTGQPSGHVAVTWFDDEPVTYLGADLLPSHTESFRRLNRPLRAELSDAFTVCLVDPVPGRNTILWPTLNHIAIRIGARHRGNELLDRRPVPVSATVRTGQRAGTATMTAHW